MTTVMTWTNETGARQMVLPSWVPTNVGNYLAHTECGAPIRALARGAGCHASTILRQIRRVETQRDDPLVDAALRHLGETGQIGQDAINGTAYSKGSGSMKEMAADAHDPDADMLNRESLRVLRRLCETGAVLAVAEAMEKAVVVRDIAGTSSTRTAVVDSAIAEAMAVKNWITAISKGKITRYKITSKGRAALAEFIAQDESAEARKTGHGGFSDASAGFAGKKDEAEEVHPMRRRYGLTESPLIALSRRRDRDGSAFLSDDLVRTGERLREDFELGHMGPRVTQDWDRFLTVGDRSFVGDTGPMSGPPAARARVADALEYLGPGLAEVALRCCCYLEGLETTEKRLGWSARSGKIVLRIALIRLEQHYQETRKSGGNLIG